MSQTEMLPNDYLIAQGLIFRAEIGFTGVAAGSIVYAGITTGVEELVILQRAYSSSEGILTIELFEASFTLGSAARTLNRRFNSPEQAPGTVMQGVTPGALGNAITGVTLRAPTTGGTAALSISGDDSRLYLEPLTSYVVRYTNGGGAGAAISNSFDFRKALAGNWERTLGSY